MELSEEHLFEIKDQIMNTIISYLEAGKLSNEEYEKLSDFIIDRIDKVKTQDDLLLFLRDLSHRWNMFSFILKIENGKVIRLHEHEKIEQIRKLAHEGNIEEALKIAKEVN